jgi:hypothetical protein
MLTKILEERHALYDLCNVHIFKYKKYQNGRLLGNKLAKVAV